LVLQIEGNTMGVLTLLHILISFAACAEAIRRADFPPGFVFGTASSAYQAGY
jgi:beta-glucosidase